MPVAPTPLLPPLPRPHHKAPTACAKLIRAKLTAHPAAHPLAHRQAKLPAQSRAYAPNPAPASDHKANSFPPQSTGSECLLRRLGSFQHRYRPKVDAAAPPDWPTAASATTPAPAANPPRKPQDRCRKKTLPPNPQGFAPDRTASPFPPAHGFRGKRHASFMPPAQP